MVVYQSDLRLGAANDDARTDRACFLADRGEQSVASPLDLPVAAACCQEEAVSLAVGYRLALAADLAFAVQDQNAQEGFSRNSSLHAVCESSVQVQFVDCKVVAVRHMRVLAAALYDRNAAGHSQCLLDVQVSLLAVLADAAVIVHAIGYIGVLLDLGDQDSLADRVKGAGLDEQDVALFHGDSVEHLKQCVLLDPLSEFFPCDLLFEAVIQERAFLGVENVPHLCFAILAFVLKRESVARVDLDRQVVLRVDELGQNREFPESAAMGSKHFHPLCLKIVPKGFSLVGSVHDHGRAVRMTGELPRLSQDVSFIFNIILIYQSVPAPQIVLAGRF